MRRLKNLPKFPEPPERLGKSRKNRKKWCKGKKGVEHIYEWRPGRPYGIIADWRIEVCTTCGKHGKWQYVGDTPWIRKMLSKKNDP